MSWIMSKDKSSLINTNHISCMYITADGRCVRAITGVTDKSYRMADYATYTETATALEMIYKILGRDQSCVFPDDEEVQAKVRLVSDNFNKFSQNGKKPVRRGGS